MHIYMFMNTTDTIWGADGAFGDQCSGNEHGNISLVDLLNTLIDRENFPVFSYT